MADFDFSPLLLFGGPRGWESRLLKKITLKSPEGNTYIGKWRKSNDPQTKALGTFKVVGGNNGQVQDLGVDPRTTSFIVYFDGPDCDKSSEAFMSSLEEFGPWEINHPVRGKLTNQYPTGFDPTHDPTESGNIVAVSTSWITSTDPPGQSSQAQRSEEIITKNGMINGDAVIDFISNTGTETLNLRNKVEQATNDFKTAIDIAFVQPISTVKGGLENMESAYNGVVSTLDQFVYGATDLAKEFVTQTVYLGQRPAQILKENEDRLASYDLAVRGILGNEPTGTTAEKRSYISTMQMTATGTMGGMCLSVINNKGIKTRNQAVQASALLYSTFVHMVDTLDGYADTFPGLFSERYFSLTNTFSNLLDLITACQRYLLNLAVGLKREKTVYIDRPMSAIIASLTYYGDTISVYQLIRDNKLKPEEIMCMCPGRKLVIYV